MHSVSSNAVAEANSYVIGQEVKTGGKFFDGTNWKDVYRKVFNYGTITGNSFTLNTNINLERLVNYGGSVKVSDIIRPFPYFDTTSNMKFIISSVRENLVDFYTAWGFGTEFIFMIEYTKTTDNAA